MRKVFTDNLPKHGTRNDWLNSEGYELKFEHDDIKGVFKILSYSRETGKITLEYNNKNFEIALTGLISCKISTILGIINPNHRHEIGDMVNDKLKITKLLRGKRNVKRYEYECVECGNVDGITEYMIKMGCSCNVCGTSPNKITYGVNSLADTNPHVVKHLANKEDAEIYSKGTCKKIEWVCEDCGQHKMLTPNTFIKNGIMCDRCSDGKSFPNKIMFSVLQQLLDCKFENEKRFNWCKFKKYNKEKEQVGSYDFYFKLNKREYIVEMDGELGHGRDTTFTTLEETNYIDDIKDKLAKDHNIEVIRIPCPAKFEIIKQNVLDSSLGGLFDLSKIEWNKCIEYSSQSLVFKAVNHYNDGKVVSEIESIMKISDVTIRKFLKLGREMGICNYGSDEANKRQTKINSKNKRERYSKEIICLENSEVFSSLHDCEDNSEERCGIKFSISGLCRVCNGKQDNTKGFHFKYISDLTPQERILYKLDEESQSA